MDCIGDIGFGMPCSEEQDRNHQYLRDAMFGSSGQGRWNIGLSQLQERFQKQYVGS